MKKPAYVLSILIVLLFSISGNATTFSLMSTINSINGNLNVALWNGTEWVAAYSDYYGETSSASLDRSIEYLDCHALSAASYNGVYVNWDSYSWGPLAQNDAFAVAYAKTISTFKPISIGENTPITFFDTSSWTHTFAWAEIKDLTTDEVIFTTYPDDFSYFPLIHRFTYSGWALSHEYQLTMQVWGGDSGLSQDGGISTDLSFVAEPGTVILLGLGLLGMVAWRRKPCWQG